MTASGSGLLPTHQRFVNGVPVPGGALTRRAFRPREKYLIVLVLLTFGVVCFGAFFFLPELRGQTQNGVYNVYIHMQKAGPELLIPAPPHGSALETERHDLLGQPDPHHISDKAKLQAKIEQDDEMDRQRMKVLQRPDIGLMRVSSSTSAVPNFKGKHRDEESPLDVPIVIIPPKSGLRVPDVNEGADRDPLVRTKREKVKEVSTILTFQF